MIKNNNKNRTILVNKMKYKNNKKIILNNLIANLIIK